MPPLPEPEADLDAPTSSKAVASGTAGGGGGGGEGDGAASDSGEDDVPDYRFVASLVRSSKKAGGSAAGSGAAYIPKRGEKDFEPTGVGGQNRALEESRRAMDEVIRGERRIGAKALSYATWDPALNRAIVHIVRGQIFNGLGTMVKRAKTADELVSEVSSKGKGKEPDLEAADGGNAGKPERQALHKARLELLPEEALFLVERGSLLCFVRREGPISDFTSEADDRSALEPMSAQQAFATMIGSDGCTRERYQVYAYLKRLGYYVQRASVADELRKTAASARAKSTTTVAIRTSPRSLVRRAWQLIYALFSQVVYLPVRIIVLPYQAVTSVTRALRQAAQRAATALQRKSSRRSEGLLGLGGRKWDSYNSVFAALQIVPSGHDRPAVVPSASAAPTCSPYDIYYYAWRPATTYKKSDPPPPEFRIAIVDARRSALPASHEFSALFAAVPIPRAGAARHFFPTAGGTADEEDEGLDDDERRMREQARRNAEAYGKVAAQRMREKEAERRALREATARAKAAAAGIEYVPPPPSESEVRGARIRTPAPPQPSAPVRLLTHVATLFAHLPPGTSARPASTSYVSRPRPPNPFPPLKAGRRNVVLAVVDSGTTSIFRFGEAEFEKWRLAGASLAGEGGAGAGASARIDEAQAQTQT